mgnify:CR=1 FL=1
MISKLVKLQRKRETTMRALPELLALLAMASLFVIAVSASGVGQLKISPALPLTLRSPATFETWVQGNGNATDPHIFLVMTESCYKSLTGDVKVEWNGGSLTIHSVDWTKESSVSTKIPPGTTNGASYTVASLKSELTTSGPIYWAFKPFLGGQKITQTKVPFTVTLPSTSPRMLVYVLGKSECFDPCTQGTPLCSALFDMRVPPSIPGFVVPEPGPIFATLAFFGALAVFAAKRWKTA